MAKRIHSQWKNQILDPSFKNMTSNDANCVALGSRRCESAKVRSARVAIATRTVSRFNNPASKLRSQTSSRPKFQPKPKRNIAVNSNPNVAAKVEFNIEVNRSQSGAPGLQPTSQSTAPNPSHYDTNNLSTQGSNQVSGQTQLGQIQTGAQFRRQASLVGHSTKI